MAAAYVEAALEALTGGETQEDMRDRERTANEWWGSLTLEGKEATMYRPRTGVASMT